jgi:hypothetical protein
MILLRLATTRSLAFVLAALLAGAGEAHSASDAELGAISSTQLSIDASVREDDAPEAFRVGAEHLAKIPDDVVTLTELSIYGVQRLKRGDASYASQAETYGRRAIEIIEGDRKPAHFESSAWQEYKTRWLPELYRSLGTAAHLLKRREEAKARFAKAASLDPKDPANPLMLGTIANEEYREQVEAYKAAPPGAVQESLKRALATLDEVIDQYARAAALSEDRPEYRELHDQVMRKLEQYDVYRHKSSDGLQEAIAKHRAKP